MTKRHHAAAHLFGHAGTDQTHLLPGRDARATLASGLRWLARRLRRAAQRLGTQAGAGRTHAAELEFHAEAGAPEGALYVNGEFIGHLPGVNRL